MRTMSIVALVALAFGCSGTRESARTPESVGGEVQAERGDMEGTPGLDEAATVDGNCWVVGEVGAEGTPGLDATATRYECASSPEIESDMP